MASIYKRGKCYYLQWYESGKRKRQSLGKVGLADARQSLARKELELLSGAAKHKKTLAEFVPEYLRWHKAEYPASHTRIEQIIRLYLLPWFGDKYLNEIICRIVEHYKVERKEKAAVETVNKELRTLKAILNKALEWEEIERVRILR